MTGPIFNGLLHLASKDKSIKIEIEEVIATHFKFKRPSLYERGKYGLSKKYTDIRHSEKNWHSLGEHGIILGTLPYANQCDEIIEHAAKDGKPLGLVISIVDYFELGGDIIIKEPAKPLNWSDTDIEHYCQPMQDFTSKISITAIILAIDKMRACLLENKSVYIHCKAGVGRSYLMALIYLAIFDSSCADLEAEAALDKAISIIKPIRTQVNLGSKRQKALDAISIIKKILKLKDIPLKEEKQTDILSIIPTDEKEMKSIPLTNSSVVESEEPEELPLSEEFIKVPVPAPLQTTTELAKLNEFLALPQTKLEIAQLVSFKELGIYAASIVEFIGFANRVSIIDSFFREIGDAKNADWYLRYHEKLSPLLGAQPMFVKRPVESDDKDKSAKTKDAETRENLYRNFYNDMTNYINRKLGFKMEICREEKQIDTSYTSSTSITDYAIYLITHGLYAISSAYTAPTPPEEKVSVKLLGS